MGYSIKEKLAVTDEFLNDLIAKNWQEVEAIQQQIANIDTDTKLGIKVSELLKNICTNYYVLIGCLETLLENPDAIEIANTEQEIIHNISEQEKDCNETASIETESEKLCAQPTENIGDFEPFEYFVDFDDPSGMPISDKDLYG